MSKKISHFIALLIIQLVMFPNIVMADPWKKTTIDTEISLKHLFLDNYAISPNSNWLIFLPDDYVMDSIITINLVTGMQVHTTGYSDQIEKEKKFRWTIFWKNENEAILRKKWTHKITFNEWQTEEYYYELVIHDKEVVVNKMQYTPDNNIRFVDIYSEKHNFELFSDLSSISVNELSSRHPEIVFKETSKGSLIFCFNGELITEHKKKSVMNFFHFNYQLPNYAGLTISPDKNYIIYGISWFGGGWSIGPLCLYLFDIKKMKVTLIDEHYIRDTMLWSTDSKKFIYRHSNDDDRSVQLMLIKF